jgi:hypothetical protein
MVVLLLFFFFLLLWLVVAALYMLNLLQWCLFSGVPILIFAFGGVVNGLSGAIWEC